MQNNSQSKYALVAVAVLILIALVFFLKNPQDTPYKALPSNNETDTTVSLYKNAPPNFPMEVILENKTLDYSGEVKTAQGKTQTTVSYISDKNMQDVVAMYTDSLPKIGWEAKVLSNSANVAIISAAKTDQKIILTISPLKAKGVMVTFQYDK